MKLRLPIHSLFVTAIMTVWLTACGGGGGGSSTPPAAITVIFNFASVPPASLTVGATIAVAAGVTNDSKNAGVTWTASCGSSQCGSFSPTSTASGTITTYTAPAAVPNPATVTLTATSVTDPVQIRFRDHYHFGGGASWHYSGACQSSTADVACYPARPRI